MEAATCLSIQYCFRIRAGENVRHSMQWDVLRQIQIGKVSPA
jgi:hypothetical protein